jgi:hypothetical protein
MPSQHVVLLLMPTRHTYGKYLIVPAEDGAEYLVGVNLDGPWRQHYNIYEFLILCQKDLATAVRIAQADAQWCPELADVARCVANLPRLKRPHGGGRYTLSNGVLELFGISYNYGGVERAHLGEFRKPIERYCAEHGIALVEFRISGYE